ncbi:MAG: hypothetical protein OES10_15350 [Gammaproteobacteria bacterium]|nr:hypothetical protein [Gammaproteobacteria bacterium]
MTENAVNILSALPLVGHPRDSKRISMLKQAGFCVEAVAFNRPYHSGRLPDCQVGSLGDIESGRYIRRLLKMVRVLPTVRRAMRRNDVVYASGPDMALLALVAGLGLRKPVVLEVGDIREVQLLAGIFGRLIRWLDKRLLNRCALLVVTAPKFLDVYYREWLNSPIPAIVIENKLEADFADKASAPAMRDSGRVRTDADRRSLRIGYFGGLRCEWSWSVLRDLAVVRPADVEIILAGYPMNPRNLPDEVTKYDNIEYLGEYRSPQDLPSLYAQIDLVWACYQHIGPNDWNLRWARPNRFYESCLFGKPLVSRAGSCDAGEVERFNIGLVIAEEGIDPVVKRIAAITTEDLDTWTRNVTALPRSVYVYTSEVDQLAKEIRKISSEWRPNNRGY